MDIPLVDLQAQTRGIRAELDEAVGRVLDGARFVLGEEVERFEGAFAAFCGADHCVGVASGTAALHLALRACGVGPGDEVITTPFTFFATVEAILYCGARPVFADIDPRTFTLDPAQAAARITSRTRAILPVHLYGHPADMDGLLALAGEHGLRVVEDAAQAHGATWKGAGAGTLGDAGCFSFFPGKNLGAAGDGGAVVTGSAEIAARVRRLRNHGRDTKYEHSEVGFAERLDALQAAILEVKLRHLPRWTEARRAAAARYDGLLAESGLELPATAPAAGHAFHLYVVRTPRRDALLQWLQARGIGAGVHYPIPLHQQPALRPRHGHERYPHAEAAAREVLSLPLHPELTDAAQARVADAVLGFARAG